MLILPSPEESSFLLVRVFVLCKSTKKASLSVPLSLYSLVALCVSKKYKAFINQSYRFFACI